MTPWQTWLCAWKGASSLDMGADPAIPDDPWDLTALGLFAEGLVDAATLRQARLLAMGSPVLQPLLLVLLARLRQGQPRSRLSDLTDLVKSSVSDPGLGWEELDLPALKAARHAVEASVCRELSESVAALAGNASVHGPLVGTRDQDPLPLVCVEVRDGVCWLGFARQEAATDRLLRALSERLGRADTGLGPERVQAILERIDGLPVPLHERQRDAVEQALRHRFVLLTGGPGTGKTTVVACMLWGLLQADQDLHGESIVLCAPTGRAQARLAESVQANLSRLPGGAVQIRSATLHTLLGARPDGSFRHDAGNPLPYRVVVVDEASMIDLAMFAALVAAVPSEAHLVLVGDPDQLPSVEAGAVLADLLSSPRCQAFRAGLTKVFRNTGEISQRSRDFQQGQWHGESVARLSLAEWNHGTWRQGEVLHLGGTLEALLELWVERGSSPGRDQRILCVTHGGPSGREAVNRVCDDLLRKRTGLRGRFLPGQPVMLTRNLPERNLWNGDLGVVVEEAGELVVAFGEVRVRVSHLDGLESAWAITVHKSQGSEFKEVLFLLPDRDTPLLSRQIAYTALTRAKEAAYLWGNGPLLGLAASRKEDRPSRLRELA